MKEQDIDQLFKNKLENAGKTPSAVAWARLQSQLQPEAEKKKKPGMWFMYIAASVTAVLLTVGAFYLGKQETISEKMAVQQPVEHSNQNLESVTEEVKITEQAVALQVPEKIEVKEPLVKEETQAIEQKNNRSLLAGAQGNKNNKEKESETDKPAKKKPVKKPAKPTHYQTFPDNAGEIMSAQVNAVAKAEPKTETNILKGKPIEVIIQKSAEPQEAPVILASAGNAQPEAEEEPAGKLNLVKNIVQQAISLKNGDGVDLEALGIDQNNKIAYETKNAKQKISKFINL